MPTGVYEHKPLGYKRKSPPLFTDEHRKKLKETNKKWKLEHPERWKEIHIGKIPWNKGLKGWNNGHIVSEETRKKISEANKGRKNTDEVKIKMSEIQKRIGNRPPSRKGSIGYWTGKKLSEETRQKLKISHIGKTGEKSSNWQGGISDYPYPKDWTNNLRESIRQRDNYVCSECGIHQDELIGVFKKLDIHHIDYNKDNLDPDNLITLCHICHIRTNGSRDYWIKYFNK